MVLEKKLNLYYLYEHILRYYITDELHYNDFLFKTNHSYNTRDKSLLDSTI